MTLKAPSHPASGCPLCFSTPPLAELQFIDSNRDIYWAKCDLCGIYRYTYESFYEMVRLSEDDRFFLSCWAKTNNIQGQTNNLILSSNMGHIPGGYTIEQIKRLPSPRTAAARIEQALLNLSCLAPGLGDTFHITERDRFALCAKNWQEVKFVLRALEEEEMIKANPLSPVEFAPRITARGWVRITGLARNQSESEQAFIAMSFAPELVEVWREGIEPAVTSCRFKPQRVDQEEHNDKICDRIIIEIRKSKFLVADVTGQRQGVYFEAGFAMGMGIPVIWTCRKDNLENCHFDTRQYNYVVWETPEELKAKLQARIQATIL